MRAILAYMEWVGTGHPKGTRSRKAPAWSSCPIWTVPRIPSWVKRVYTAKCITLPRELMARAN